LYTGSFSTFAHRVKNLVEALSSRLSFRPHLGRLDQYEPRHLYLPRAYSRVAPPKKPPLVSVVTPSLNQGIFLERSLRSVLDQNYPRLEYIVQDGGSTDQSRNVLERYRGRLKHAESAPDRGQAHAINLGFRHAEGDVMAYLNSDDLLLPGAISYVTNFFAAHPKVDVVYGHRIVVDADDREIGRWVLPPHSDEVLRWADYVPQETLFWRRSIWDRAGGKMDESFQFALDWDLLLRFQEAGANIVCLPRFLGAFRSHYQQKTRGQLATIGEQEMQRLRHRCHGRDVSHEEIHRHLVAFYLRHTVWHQLYRLGFVR
jgi:glycosyltransferase involved in cell wall biosynthesis